MVGARFFAAGLPLSGWPVFAGCWQMTRRFLQIQSAKNASI
jgi:hypothetical protein